MRNVLITGASGGIGTRLAESFADNGYNIILHYCNGEAQADRLLRMLLEREVNALKVKADLSDAAQTMALKETVKQSFGFVDTVINNAGISHFKLFTDETDADFDKVTGANFKSVFNVTRAFAPDMLSNRFGRIINISSMWGQVGSSMEALYSASKAAVDGLTRALAKEFGPSGVTVNAISPGLIDTPMNNTLSEETLKELLNNIPVGRMGLPDDIARCALYLADEKSSFITGSIINISGGMI